jgi:hypothetical protein
MYASAADDANEGHPNSLHVLSHLLGMAIELTLKAFLVNSGWTERDLRRLSHDLPALLAEAEKLGLTPTGSRHFRLSVLGANYEDRIFAYPTEALLTVIMPWSLREVAHGLIREVFVTIKGEQLFNELQNEPGLSIRSVYPHDLDASAWAALPNGTIASGDIKHGSTGRGQT